MSNSRHPFLPVSCLCLTHKGFYGPEFSALVIITFRYRQFFESFLGYQ